MRAIDIPMHIALINQFYPPARAPTGVLLQDLARALRGRGHAVTVIASAGAYPGAVARASADADGVSVLRLGGARPHGTGLWRKALDYLRFFPRADRALARVLPRPMLSSA